MYCDVHNEKDFKFYFIRCMSVSEIWAEKEHSENEDLSTWNDVRLMQRK